MRAAERAAALEDYDAEAHWYACAYEGLRYAEHASADRGAELMLALGRAHRHSGRPAAARQALDRVIELSRSGGASADWATEAQQELEQLPR